MRIEALEDIKSGRYLVTAGDIIVVPDEQGIAWCSNGWAKDISGVVSTGPRVLQKARVNPKKASVEAKAVEV